MTVKRAQQKTIGKIPDFDSAVLTAGSQPASIRTDRDCNHGTIVPRLQNKLRRKLLAVYRKKMAEGN